MHISMENINKSFNGNAVLRDACIYINDGEIHALIGENGAGKSTLMNILTGIYKKDSGIILVDDKEVNYKTPQEAEKDGIVFIHQELNVLYDLTVEENIFLGREICNRIFVCDRKSMNKECKKIFDILGVDINPDTVMANLSLGQQQMVEIAKALMADAKVIIMDEPTAVLTESETQILFEIIRSLKEKGVSIIFISHRMEEIFELCDRVTILRDGQYIGSKEIINTNIDELVRMMIDNEISERFPERNVAIGDVLFEAKNLTHKSIFSDISFSVRSGEVLGVAGLMGSGRTEIMQSIFGNIEGMTGHILVNGREIKNKNPMDAIKNGFGFITENRRIEGLMLEDSIMKNISIVNLNKIAHKGIIDFNAERNMVNKCIKDLDIKCISPNNPCKNLSGGNQQKVVFAKWISSEPSILLLDEPTRGVDVGAKQEIYKIINEMAAKGVAIIMISSELPELIGMSDRIMVIYEGRVKGFVDREYANQGNVMKLATGGSLNEQVN